METKMETDMMVDLKTNLAMIVLTKRMTFRKYSIINLILEEE